MTTQVALKLKATAAVSVAKMHWHTKAFSIAQRLSSTHRLDNSDPSF
jgi:hypothetical protein